MVRLVAACGPFCVPWPGGVLVGPHDGGVHRHRPIQIVRRRLLPAPLQGSSGPRASARQPQLRCTAPNHASREDRWGGFVPRSAQRVDRSLPQCEPGGDATGLPLAVFRLGPQSRSMTTESTVVAVRGDQVAEGPGQGDAPARRLGEIAALVSAIAAVAGILLGIFGGAVLPPAPRTQRVPQGLGRRTSSGPGRY